MKYRIACVIAAVALVGATSCSSSPEAGENDTPVEEPAGEESAKPDVVDAYEDGAEWLPRDVNVVVAGSWTPVFDRLGDGLLPTALPDGEPGAVGTVEGVREDLREILSKEFGFDPTPGDTVVIGASPPQTVVAVVFGDFDEPDRERRVDEIVDRAVYEFDVEEAPTDRIRAAFVDEPRTGLVVAMEPGQLEASLAGRADETTLASSATGQEFTRLFGHIEGSSMGAAFSLGQLRQMIGADQPIPESGAAGYRSNRLEAVVEADDSTLEQIEELLVAGIQQFTAEFEDEYVDAEPGTIENISAIYMRHFQASVTEQLEPEIEDGRMRVDLQLTESPYQQFMWLGMAAGLAVPAFATYQQRAAAAAGGGDVVVEEVEPVDEPPRQQPQAGEPEEIVELAADAAQSYFEFDQVHTSLEGDEPWHADPDEEPGLPVAFDNKVFPGGPGIVVETTADVPDADHSHEPSPKIVDGDVDFEAEDVFRALDLDVQLVAALGYRLVYETGQGSGEEATATIRVQATGDDGIEEWSVDLEVGSDLGAQRSPLLHDHQ